MSLSQGGVFLSCPGPVDLGVLLPHLAGVIVEAVTAAAGLLLVTARARAPEAACPKCGTVSRRVHSRYCRTLADAAVGGRPAAIALTVRRFFCPDPGCPRKTFAEQVDGLTTRYARKTPLLTAMLASIAVALAGRAGSRLAAGLGAPASRQVLLRLVMAAPDPRQGPGAGPRRRHQRPDHALELRPRRGPCQPHQDDQAPDVRPRQPAPAPQARPAHRPAMTSARTLTKLGPDPRTHRRSHPAAGQPHIGSGSAK